jgi:mono/diheme cytochrome c family protein
MVHARTLLLALGLTVTASGLLLAAERHPMTPRVPADKLKEARALTSPLPDSPGTIEKGKALYNGKGTCFNCHGKDGIGNGPAAVGLDPSPRNFHHHGFWRHRTEGEIFWVIKQGIAGTAMIPFGGVLTDEVIWSIIQYERSFAGERGPGRGPGPREGMGRMEPGNDMSERGSHGPSGGMGRGEGECCAGPETTR